MTQQHVDTVFVAVPQAVDSLTVRIASLADTVQAVVRQTGGQEYTIATLVLTGVLIVATILLQIQSNRVQRDQANLQRAMIDMQDRHETERRSIENHRERERERAVDARISAIAFAVKRQIQSWLVEASDEVRSLVAIVDAWNAAAKQQGVDEPGEPAAITPGLIAVAANWASRRTGVHFDRAEERLLQLAADAPEASELVAKEVRRALAVFYNATGRMNRQVSIYGAHEVPSVRELTAAFHELEHCERLLDAAVLLGRGRQPEGPGDST